MTFGKVYIQALRLPFLTGSLMPVAVGWALACWQQRTFSPLMLLITAIGVGALHCGGNLINDYFDSFGSDPINVHLTPFSGGSRVIQEGGLTPAAVRNLAYFCFALGAAAGIFLIFRGRPWVAVIGALGLAAGYFYSARPLSFMNRGLGELTIFFAFGPLITLGTYYVQTGRLTLAGALVGLPLGLLITAVIWINEFPDFEADFKAGKHHLVTRLGLEKSRWVYAALMLGPFVSLLCLVECFKLPDLIVAALVPLPLAIKGVHTAFKTDPTTPEFVPAQALTIQTHLLMGLMLTLALLYAAWRR
jgi:1,4-dihydroxy-2-naphthoate octaprenyltransferase